MTRAGLALFAFLPRADFDLFTAIFAFAGD